MAPDIVYNKVVPDELDDIGTNECNYLVLLSRNAAAGASMGDSLAEPRALTYASRTAYVSHA